MLSRVAGAGRARAQSVRGTLFVPAEEKCVFDADCPRAQVRQPVCATFDLPDGGPLFGKKRFGEPCDAGAQCGFDVLRGWPLGSFCSAPCGERDAASALVVRLQGSADRGRRRRADRPVHRRAAAALQRVPADCEVASAPTSACTSTAARSAAAIAPSTVARRSSRAAPPATAASSACLRRAPATAPPRPSRAGEVVPRRVQRSAAALAARSARPTAASRTVSRRPRSRRPATAPTTTATARSTTSGARLHAYHRQRHLHWPAQVCFASAGWSAPRARRRPRSATTKTTTATARSTRTSARAPLHDAPALRRLQPRLLEADSARGHHHLRQRANDAPTCRATACEAGYFRT